MSGFDIDIKREEIDEIICGFSSCFLSIKKEEQGKETVHTHNTHQMHNQCCSLDLNEQEEEEKGFFSKTKQKNPNAQTNVREVKEIL